jgi:thymidylate synthase
MIQSTTNSVLAHSINHQVLKTLQEIDTEGRESSPRGMAVKALELKTLKLDPNFSLMDFESRPFNWKYFMGELSWYLIKDNNIDWINNFSSFWKNIADDAGTVNSNYGTILFGEQLQWAIDSLKKDKNTRQAVCFVNRPKFQYEGNKDFVCTMYINFWITDNQLDMKVQMRSNDIFYGLTYDAPFFAFLQQSMWHWLKDTYEDLELGTYYHCADNMHYYERHFELAQTIQFEEPKDPYFFHLREPLFTITNNNYLLLQAGRDFLADVATLVNSGEKITQEESFNILIKYFYIQ